MTGPTRMIGRAKELATLISALEVAETEGRGHFLLVSGAAGIGKSLLVDETAREARARGLTTAWGRAWEVGGAPAYWPFIQIIRDVLDTQTSEEAVTSFGDGARYWASLVPEVSDLDVDAGAPRLEANQERFRLCDSLARYLHRAAKTAPRLLVLEDLHAADRESLLLLDFLSRSIARTAIVIVGTYRPGDARSAGVAEVLPRVGPAFTQIELSPLEAEHVKELVVHLAGDGEDPTLVETVVRASEGNPLFATELTRLAQHGTAPSRTAALPLPDGVRSVILERVRRLPDRTARALGAAAIVGRELTLPEACAVLDEAPEAVAAALTDAETVGLLHRTGQAAYRFAHVLVREAIHQASPQQEREAQHLRLARFLEARHREDPAGPVARIAHHFAEAGPGASEEAVLSSVRAAERALAVHAHSEAASHYGRALDALAVAAPEDSARRAALLISHGRALLREGALDEGKEACREAARIARLLGSPELLARAALEYGSIFTYARVDPELIALLEEARGVLPEGPSPLLARVLARLAAAMQPSRTPAQPIAMARHSIAMARELGDDRTLLQVIRSASSAMIDFVDPSERIPIDRQHIELATRLDEPVEVLRGISRTLFSYVELGDMGNMLATVDEYAKLARALDQPDYEWKAFAFRAMLAILRGELALARAHRARASVFATRSADMNAKGCLLLQGMALARASFDEALMAEVEANVPPFGHPFFDRALEGIFAGFRGDLDTAQRAAAAIDAEALAGVTDCHALGFAAEVALYGDRPDLARAALDGILAEMHRNLSWGMAGMAGEGPMSFWAAITEWYLGDVEQAERHFVDARTRAEATGATAPLARILYEHGRRLLDGGGSRDAARGQELLGEALRLARRMETPGLEERILALGALRKSAVPQSPKAAPPEGLRLERDGDTWIVAYGLRSARVRTTKGMEILDLLVDAPGREFHVLELMSPGAALVEGEEARVDAEALGAYRARMEELKKELDEAESWNDAARSERARSELGALEAEVGRAVGLGGRARKAGRAAERARTNVQKRIRDAQKRIAAHHPEAAQYLSWTIRTGAFCCYEPATHFEENPEGGPSGDRRRRPAQTDQDLWD